MQDNRVEIEQLTLEQAKKQIELLIEALGLCNESRNRLTQFQSTSQFWINEAINQSK